MAVAKPYTPFTSTTYSFFELRLKVTTQLWNILGNAGTVMWSVLAATSLTIFAELSCTTGF
jgi:hypothetical protein